MNHPQAQVSKRHYGVITYRWDEVGCLNMGGKREHNQVTHPQIVVVRVEMTTTHGNFLTNRKVPYKIISNTTLEVLPWMRKSGNNKKKSGKTSGSMSCGSGSKKSSASADKSEAHGPALFLFNQGILGHAPAKLAAN